jgi:hypothetical protein
MARTRETSRTFLWLSLPALGLLLVLAVFSYRLDRAQAREVNDAYEQERMSIQAFAEARADAVRRRFGY